LKTRKPLKEFTVADVANLFGGYVVKRGEKVESVDDLGHDTKDWRSHRLLLERLRKEGVKQ
jgi:hypothetical protein